MRNTYQRSANKAKQKFAVMGARPLAVEVLLSLRALHRSFARRVRGTKRVAWKEKTAIFSGTTWEC